MNKYTSNLFESIKDALTKKTNTESSFKDFLKLEMGKTYVVRLIPNTAAPERTFFHYYHHLWKSVVTNQNISFLCPQTYGEKCPVEEYRSRVYRTNNESEIKKIQPIRRNENWLANIFVIKDPTNPENQGQIKILRFGKQLNKIITDAISGDDSDEFGSRIFDFSENGCNLKIKVEENDGGYPTYVSSKFTSPCEVDGLTNQEEVYSNFKPLDTIFEHKSYDDLKKLLDVHFLGLEATPSPQTSNNDVEEFNSNIKITEQTTTPTINNTEEPDDFLDTDAKIQEILKDL